MSFILKDYSFDFADGGCVIKKSGRKLYENMRPMSVTVKTMFALNEFYEAAYSAVSENAGRIAAEGIVAIPSGSEFAFSDIYEPAGEGIRISRNVKVLKAGSDLGFSTKISFVLCESDNVRDYNCFAPGAWYKQNEFAPDNVMGKDLDCEYFWRMETAFALPLFAMQNISTKETVSLSRWAADVTMRSTDFKMSENSVDRKLTVGSIGMSRPEKKTLNYTYYGFALRKDSETGVNGLSIDYVYPACDGQMPSRNRYGGLDFKGKTKTFDRINHPVEDGFEQNYSVAVNFAHYDSFQLMMRDTWRTAYGRMRDKLFDVDNEEYFRSCMKIFMKYTNKYGDSYGLPFACQLPHMDVNCVAFQFGFVGQQPGIGYQMLRYGSLENVPEAYEKGEHVIDFWVESAMTDSGLPQMCYNPGLGGFEPYPHYIRMMADGVEAILDAWRFMHKQESERPEWFEFCRKAADWCVGIQNADGSFYRAYNGDSSVRMDSKANTPGIIRFLVQMYLLTENEKYKAAALSAGDWSYDNAYLNLEYRGGTCDNMDIQDKEAGIYGIFGFLSLYDLTGGEKWLEAAMGAADYTETWTYAWSYPIVTPWPNHPFNQYSISGHSIITVGGGADVYMAACSYTYYRLYLITGDRHYLDFAEFIDKNTRQSSDVDGSSGYEMPGLGHEGCSFVNQTFMSQYHWLPWCTFVEADPTSRLYDTFGAYEISEAEKLPMDERRKRNRIYDNYKK